jgi:hypothetical protein
VTESPFYLGVGEPVSIPGDECSVHAYHWPPVRETVLHHRHPVGMGGPDVKANLVRICPSGHSNVHRAVRAIIRGVKPVGTRAELALARYAVDQWTAAGKPGRPE